MTAQRSRPDVYRLTADSFSGLDRRILPGTGAWRDMLNMSLADTPVIRTRDPRTEIRFRDGDGRAQLPVITGRLSDAVSMGDTLALAGDGRVQAEIRGEAVNRQINGETAQLIRYGRGVFVSPAVVYLNEELETAASATGATPALDFATEHDNRIWGCRYGENRTGAFVNEIYASALGEPCEFYVNEGLESDSWTVSVGADGAWTGAAELERYVVFFKERCFYLVSGDGPSSYGCVKYKCPGVQRGSEKSLVQIGAYLYYKSADGVMRLGANSLPTCVSFALGADRWTDAVAGTDGRRYYIQMADDAGKTGLFVLDTLTGEWTREDAVPGLVVMARHGGALYALSQPDVRWEYDEVRALAEQPDAAETAAYARWTQLVAESMGFAAAEPAGRAWLSDFLAARHIRATEDDAARWILHRYLTPVGVPDVLTEQRYVYDRILAQTLRPGADATAADREAWEETDADSRAYALHEPAGHAWLAVKLGIPEEELTDEAWQAWLFVHFLAAARTFDRGIAYTALSEDQGETRLPSYGLRDGALLTPETYSPPVDAWLLRSGPLGLALPNKKRVREVAVRIEKERGKPVRIRLADENDADGRIMESDADAGLTTIRARFSPAAASETFSLEISGAGRAVLYGIMITYEDGGDGVC